MPNTYVNKVITGAGITLIDLSQDTVTSANHIIGGRVGHLADGSSVPGTGSKTVTYSLSSGVSTNVSPDSIVTGEGLCLRLLAPSGYDLSDISVTMGGVDITSSVFAFDTKEEPTLATKSITANGTYTASSDSADGYSSVTVNVASGVSPTLTTKSITANGTYNAADDSADGYSSVTVNVPHVGPQFALIGQSTHTLSAYTDTSTAETTNTGINIKNTNYAHILTVITCDGTKTNAKDWGGLTIAIGSRYTTNGNYYNMGSTQSKDNTLSFSNMTDGAYSQTTYGCYLSNNTSTIQFNRKANGTGCPKLMAGTYTVKVYGLTAL